MADVYATVEDYRLDTGDADSTDERIEFYLNRVSTRLRAETGIRDGEALTDDQASLASQLVIDAARKRLQPLVMEVLGDISGTTQASLSANGYSVTMSPQNPTSSAYFDQAMLRELKGLLGRRMAIGCIHAEIRR